MKKGLGFFCSILTAVVALVGLVFYFINSNTNYFVGLGKDNIIIGGAVIGIALLCAWAFFGESTASWKDILPVLAPACLIVSALMLVNSRINGVAAIMTFENNAQNQADLKSAIVAIAALLIAALLATITAFFEVKKEAK